MTSPDGRPTREDVLRFIWNYFRDKRSWPQSKPFLRELRVRGAERSYVTALDGICVGTEHVEASFDALYSLAEVKELLTPLPALLRFASQRYVEMPDFNDGPRPRVTAKEVQDFWPDPARGRLAAQMMEATHSPLLQCGGRATADEEIGFFSPMLDSLRYHNVQTLDDIDAARRGPLWMQVTEPDGIYLDILRRIHAHVMKTGNWPIALPFVTSCVEELGFVAEHIRHLQPHLINGNGVPRFRHDELQLRLNALPWVQPSALPLIVSIVQTLSNLWDDSSEAQVNVSIRNIAAELRIPGSELLGILRYLEEEPWKSGGDYPNAYHPNTEWRVILNEKIEECRHVDSFEMYCRKRTELGAFFDIVLPGHKRATSKHESSLLSDPTPQLQTPEVCEPPAAPIQEAAVVLNLLATTCARFAEAVAALKQRREGRTPLTIEDEYDLQYLFHFVLRLAFNDVRPEEATTSHAGKSTRIDFFLKEPGVGIELKFAREGKTSDIASEILVDLTRYAEAHSDCRGVLVFVYDPGRHIANPDGLIRDLERDSRVSTRIVVGR